MNAEVADLQPSATSNMKLFMKIVNSSQPIVLNSPAEVLDPSLAWPQFSS